MNKKEQTKETLEENKQNFKHLQATAEMMKEDFHKKLIKQIQAMDAQEKEELARITAKKKALALKGEIKENYIEEDNSPEEVPVDGEVRAGTMVFMKNCGGCHSLDAVDVKDMRGPSLGLIYNRRAGSNTNYESYSDSMLKSTFFWTAKNLYKFMANTHTLIPDTRCWLKKHPLHSEEDRADLITLFKQFTGQLTFNIRLKQIQRIGYNAYQTRLYAEQAQRERGQLRKQREYNINKKI